MKSKKILMMITSLLCTTIHLNASQRARQARAREATAQAREAAADEPTSLPLYVKNNLTSPASIEIYRGGPASEGMKNPKTGQKIAEATLQPNQSSPLPQEMKRKQTYLFKITMGKQKPIGYYVRDTRKQFNQNGIALGISSIGNTVSIRPVAIADKKITAAIGVLIFPVVEFPEWAVPKPVTESSPPDETDAPQAEEEVESPVMLSQ